MTPPRLPHRPRRAAFPAAALAITACLAGCSRAAPSPDRSAPFSGVLAGERWAGQASATLIVGGAQGDTLYVFGYDAGSAARREVSIALRIAPFTGPGRYTLGVGDVRLSELVGGDVLVASYEAAARGSVVVRTFGGAGATIAGSAAFTVDRSSATGVFGSTVAFTDGEFQAPVIRCCPVAQGGAAPGR
jgi:hypothetical protein